MAYEIIWTDEAENDLSSIVSYLKENWSYESAERFLANVNDKLAYLVRMPSLVRPTSKPNHFLYQIDRKNVLFLTFSENYIVLLSIYPYKRDISRSRYY